MRVRIARLELDRAPIGRDGFVEPALGAQGIAKIVVGFGIVWLQFDCLVKRRNRFGMAQLVRERVAEIMVGIGVIGPQTQRLFVSGDRLWQAPLSAENYA